MWNWMRMVKEVNDLYIERAVFSVDSMGVV